MRGIRAKALPTLALFAATFVAHAVPADAHASHALPYGFGAIAVDGAHNHVLVSSPASNAITVLDYDGQTLTSIAGESGAGSLLVDGNRLYVALAGTAGVDVFDTATFSKIGTLGGAALAAPSHLTMAGGTLWATTGSCNDGSMRLASIDTGSGAVSLFDTYVAPGDCLAGVASNPALAGELLTWNNGGGPSTLNRYDISSGTPVLVASASPSGLAGVSQLVPSPDATTFFTASSASGVGEFDTATLSPDGNTFSTGYYGPSALAVTPGAGGRVAAASNSFPQSYLFGYGIGDPSTPIVQGVDGTVFPGGLAWSPDGNRVFEVTQGMLGPTLVVWTIADPMTASVHAGQSPVLAGDDDTYDVVLANPNDASTIVDTAAVDLPAGFTYHAHSTVAFVRSGAGTYSLAPGEPAISGTHLEWTFSSPVPVNPLGYVELAFTVSTGTTPGTYTAGAGGSGSVPIVPAVGAAPVKVIGRSAISAQPAANTAFLLRARVTDYFSHQPLAGRTVVFSTGGSSICTSTTNAAGIATCDARLRATDIVHNHGYDATAQASDSYNAASTSAGLT